MNELANRWTVTFDNSGNVAAHKMYLRRRCAGQGRIQSLMYQPFVGAGASVTATMMYKGW